MAEQVKRVETLGIDGLNLDIEGNSAHRDGLTALVRELRGALSAADTEKVLRALGVPCWPLPPEATTASAAAPAPAFAPAAPAPAHPPPPPPPQPALHPMQARFRCRRDAQDILQKWIYRTNEVGTSAAARSLPAVVSAAVGAVRRRRDRRVSAERVGALARDAAGDVESQVGDGLDDVAHLTVAVDGYLGQLLILAQPRHRESGRRRKRCVR